MNKGIFKSKGGKIHPWVDRQIRGYRIEDPACKRQAPVSPLVLRFILKTASTEREVLIANLVIGAFFFACRSCEYSKTTGEPRTRILRIEDMQFLKREEGVVRVKEPSDDGLTAVRIVFRLQKNLHKEEMVTQHASGDKALCPVRAWGYVCKRALKSGRKKGAVNMFEGDKGDITYSDIDGTIKEAVGQLSKVYETMNPADYGTHSVRSGAALAMYLGKTAVIDIMLQGRWSSDAFFDYIRRQILELSAGVSSDMIGIDNFETLPPRQHAGIIDRSNKALTFRGSSRDQYIKSPCFHLLN